MYWGFLHTKNYLQELNLIHVDQQKNIYMKTLQINMPISKKIKHKVQNNILKAFM